MDSCAKISPAGRQGYIFSRANDEELSRGAAIRELGQELFSLCNRCLKATSGDFVVVALLVPLLEQS